MLLPRTSGLDKEREKWRDSGNVAESGGLGCQRFFNDHFALLCLSSPIPFPQFYFEAREKDEEEKQQLRAGVLGWGGEGGRVG